MSACPKCGAETVVTEYGNEACTASGVNAALCDRGPKPEEQEKKDDDGQADGAGA